MSVFRKIGGYIIAGAATAIGGFLGKKLMEDVTDPCKQAHRRSLFRNIKLKFVR